MTDTPKRRQSISPRIRFEVFKRDTFKCQYCGAAAPDVLLQVDHIKPIVTGGEDDLLNYVTSCATCNGGKGPRELSDDSMVTRQRRQLEELQERRAQLEMMIQWRDGLQDLEDVKIQVLADKLDDRLAAHDSHLSPAGRDNVRVWLRKFGFDAVLHGIQQAYDTEPVKLILQVEQFAAAAKKVAKEPQLRDYWRIRARLRGRGFRYGPEWAPINDMRRAFAQGWTIADMDEAAGLAVDYDDFRERIGYK